MLDEHFKGHKANAWRAANGTPWVAEASQAERTECKIAGRAVFGSLYPLQRRASMTARLSHHLNSQTRKAGVARGRHNKNNQLGDGRLRWQDTVTNLALL